MAAASEEKSLRHMIRFVRVFPDAQIVSALRSQLSWSHFKQQTRPQSVGVGGATRNA